VTVFDQTSGDSANAIPEEPAWSSDGKSIVFNRTTWGADGNPKSGVLQVLDVASGSVRTLPIDSSRVPVPGDAHWSPIGSTILFSNYPVSSTGSIAGLPPGGTYTVGSDGFGLKRLNDNAGASYLSDGRIVSQNNYFWVMNADATDLRPVNMQGDDLTELNVGFAYIPHWVGVP
jgi:Tol biopolymer transport system component